MRVIRDLVYVIKDELKDARKAANFAAKYKGLDPATAEVFANVAKQKLDSATGALHGRAIALIKAHKASGKETPPVMQAIWDYEHEQLMEDAAEVGVVLKTYKGA